jgi:hypothetical protein
VSRNKLAVGGLALAVAIVVVGIVVAQTTDDPTLEAVDQATTTSQATGAESTSTTDDEAVVDPGNSTSPASRDEGRVRLLAHAKSRFDPWTEAPTAQEKEAMRSLYDWMVVYSPYFDDRLEWFENGLAYVDLYAIYPDKESDTRAEDHPDWILQDEAGNRLFVDWGCEGGTCPQWAGDVGNPAFRSDLIDRIGELVDKGYPGVMIDDVNLDWRISNGDGETIVPIDPRTGEEMTLESWRQYVVTLVEEVRDAFPDVKIMHNAIWYADSPQFSDGFVKRQAAAADWIMLERGATDKGLKGGNGKFSLAKFMEFVDMAHGEGAGVLLLDEDATTITEQSYNLAAYLLISSGSDLVTTEDYPLIAPESVWPAFELDLGDALGPRYRWERLWRRDFSGGVVLLSDPEGGSRTVSVGAGFVDASGQTIDQIELGPREAVILLNES